LINIDFEISFNKEKEKSAIDYLSKLLNTDYPSKHIYLHPEYKNGKYTISANIDSREVNDMKIDFNPTQIDFYLFDQFAHKRLFIKSAKIEKISDKYIVHCNFKFKDTLF
jgi:hypothetical protein